MALLDDILPFKDSGDQGFELSHFGLPAAAGAAIEIVLQYLKITCIAVFFSLIKI